MISSILLSLQKLQADLAAIDPSRETEAADVVADLACALRDRLAAVEDERRRMTPTRQGATRSVERRDCPIVPKSRALA